ncbi:MAG TPA: hypothetical protein VGK73_27175 [Polyangiaceae bacterium]
MNRLERLTENEAADPELARLFRAGRPPAPLSRAAFERSRGRLRLGVPAGLGVLVWIQHAALGAALGATVAVVAAWPRLSSHFAPPAAPSAAPARSRERESVPALPRPTTPPPAPISPEERQAPRPKSAALPSVQSAAPENPLLRESALLERARAELDRQPATSLRLLAEHEREFPNGTLAVERDFLTVAGLLKLGQRDRAEARAAALRARAPGSLYAQRLDRLLGGDGTP